MAESEHKSSTTSAVAQAQHPHKNPMKTHLAGSWEVWKSLKLQTLWTLLFPMLAELRLSVPLKTIPRSLKRTNSVSMPSPPLSPHSSHS